MSLADQVLAVNDDLPIHTDETVHSGKVRSVYWLTEEDGQRLIKEKGYDVAPWCSVSYHGDPVTVSLHLIVSGVVKATWKVF